jgi:A/G-specific adenine glycosylase
VHGVAALVLRGGRALAVRRPARGLLGGLWELPGGELEHPARDAASVAALLGARTGLALERVEPAGRLEHLFTHRRLRLRVYRARARSGRVRLDGWDRHRWVSMRGFGALPLGSVSRRAFALALGRPEEDR